MLPGTILHCGSTLKMFTCNIFLILEGEHKKKLEHFYWRIVGNVFLLVLDSFALLEYELTSFILLLQPQTCFQFKFRATPFMHRSNRGVNGEVEFDFQNF